MTRGIRIAIDLELPVDVVTQPIAILARRGAGKTYTASVLVEEVVRAKVPVVVLDPTGAWWGLRSSVDGQSPGLPVVIFGGDHGDVPLEQTAGTVIADVVLEHPGAYVVDLSAFPSKAAEQRFASDFLERLYRGKKAATGPLLLVVDEADIFAPQRPGPEQTRTLGALEAIVRRGRIKGLGDLLISQRAAVLNKNVLTQTEVLVAMQTTGPQDRAAIDAWIEGNGSKEEREEVLGSLAGLERGEAWVWSPAFLRILQRVRIRARTTFDSSRTPEAGERRIVPRAFASVDLEQLGERIRATAEQARANDPAELRKRIRDLEKAPVARPAVQTVEKIVEVEVPVLNGQVPELRKALDDLFATVDTLAEFGKRLVTVSSNLRDLGGGILTAIDRVQSAPRPAVQPPRPAVHQASSAERPTGAPAAAAPAARAVGVLDASPPASLGRAEKSILAALASYPAGGLTREQLAFLAGYHPRSKGFTNALGTLRSGALISPGFPAELTEAGYALAPRGSTSTSLAEHWLERFGRAERAILARLIELYPGAGERVELSAVAGFEHVRSKGFTNALGRLRGLGLVDGMALHPDFARLMGR